MTDEPRTVPRQPGSRRAPIGVPKAVQEADAKLRAAATAADQATADRIEADKADRAAAEFDSQAAVAAWRRARRARSRPRPPRRPSSSGPSSRRRPPRRSHTGRCSLWGGRSSSTARSGGRARRRRPSTRDTRSSPPLTTWNGSSGCWDRGSASSARSQRDTVDVDHGLRFKAPTVGANQRQPVDKQLDELRDTIRGALPAPPPTEEELQREQELQERNQQWQRMARGGVHVLAATMTESSTTPRRLPRNPGGEDARFPARCGWLAYS